MLKRNTNRWPALLALLIIYAMTALDASAATKKKKGAPVKTPARTSTTARKSSSSLARRSTPRAARGRTTTSASRRRTPAPPPRQATPSRERYVEIQQALVDKGYSTESADGVWGPSWVNALRRFQADQNLEADGKLGALSIIALGLGPNRTAFKLPNPPSQQFLAKPGEPAVLQQQQ